MCANLTYGVAAGNEGRCHRISIPHAHHVLHTNKVLRRCVGLFSRRNMCMSISSGSLLIGPFKFSSGSSIPSVDLIDNGIDFRAPPFGVICVPAPLVTSAKARDCSISVSKFMSLSSYIEDSDVFDGVGDPGVSIPLVVNCQECGIAKYGKINMISLKEILTNSFNTVLEESIEKLNRKRRISVGDLRNQYEKGSKRVKIEPDLDDSGKAVNWDTKAPKSSKKAQTFKGTTRDEKARDVDHVGAHSKSNSSTHTQSASPHTSAAATPSRQISPLPVEKPRKGRRSTKSSEQEPVLPEHRFTKWLYPPQIKELNDKWVKIKQGTFDEEERRIVYDWVNNYKERNNWDNEQLRARIFAPKNEKNRDSFWNDLTEHVPHRVLASVYTHVRSRWHPYANKGIWTKDEEDRLEG